MFRREFVKKAVKASLCVMPFSGLVSSPRSVVSSECGFTVYSDGTVDAPDGVYVLREPRVVQETTDGCRELVQMDVDKYTATFEI